MQTVIVDGTSGRVIWSFNTTKFEMSSDLVMRTNELQLDFFVFRANGQLYSPHSSSQQRVIVRDGKIDSNRFTLLNCNEKFRFSTTATTL